MSEIGGDVSTLVVRASTDLTKEAAKMTNESVKQFLLYMIQKSKEQSDRAGEIALKRLIKSNDEIKLFDLEQKQLKAFSELAKKYEVTYAVVEDQKHYSVFYKQSDEARVKMVLEKLLEQGINKESELTPSTKIDEQDKSQSGLMAIQQKLFGKDNEKAELKLSSEELKQLINKHENQKLPYEVADPNGKIEMTFVIDRDGSYERIGLNLNQLDERVKRILENLKDNEKHQFDFGDKSDRFSVERQGNVFLFKAEQSKEQERGTNDRERLAVKLGKTETERFSDKVTPGERLTLNERRQAITPLMEAQKQAAPVKNKNRERGGR